MIALVHHDYGTDVRVVVDHLAAGALRYEGAVALGDPLRWGVWECVRADLNADFQVPHDGERDVLVVEVDVGTEGLARTITSGPAEAWTAAAAHARCGLWQSAPPEDFDLAERGGAPGAHEAIGEPGRREVLDLADGASAVGLDEESGFASTSMPKSPRQSGSYSWGMR